MVNRYLYLKDGKVCGIIHTSLNLKSNRYIKIDKKIEEILIKDIGKVRIKDNKIIIGEDNNEEGNECS